MERLAGAAAATATAAMTTMQIEMELTTLIYGPDPELCLAELKTSKKQ